MADDGVLSLRPGELHIARLSRDYVLDTLQDLARTIRMDHVSTLIFLGISEANGRRGGVEPKPVSLYSISRTYGLSYETARRHLMKLTAQDLIERRGDGGLIVPERVYDRDELVQLSARQAQRTGQFLAGLPGRGGRLRNDPDDREQRREITYLTHRYALEVLRLANKAVSRDFLTTLVFMTVAQLIAEQVRVLGDRVPTAQTSVYAVARRLDLPYETARRHMTKLEKAGYCVRRQRGVALSQDLHAHNMADDYLAAASGATRDYAAGLRAAMAA